MTHNITIVLDLHFSSVCDKLNIVIVSVEWCNCIEGGAAAGPGPGRGADLFFLFRFKVFR